MSGILSPVKQVFDTVHIEVERETKRLVQWIALGRGDDIARVQRENAHAEASSHREIFKITLVFALMVVSGAQRELVMVGVFHTRAPSHFLQLLPETVGGVAKTLEDTIDGRDVVIFFFGHSQYSHYSCLCRGLL